MPVHSGWVSAQRAAELGQAEPPGAALVKEPQALFDDQFRRESPPRQSPPLGLLAAAAAWRTPSTVPMWLVSTPSPTDTIAGSYCPCPLLSCHGDGYTRHLADGTLWPDGPECD